MTSSQAVTGNRLAPALSGQALGVKVCVDPRLPLPCPLSPVEPWRTCVPAALSTGPVPPQASFMASLQCADQRPSRVGQSEPARNPLHLPIELHCRFWTCPSHKGLFASLLYAQGRTDLREKQQCLCVSNCNAWMEPRNKGRPRAARTAPALCRFACSGPGLTGAVTVPRPPRPSF